MSEAVYVEWMTTAQAAEVLKVAPNTVAHMVKTGQIKTLNRPAAGHTRTEWRIAKSEVVAVKARREALRAELERAAAEKAARKDEREARAAAREARKPKAAPAPAVAVGPSLSDVYSLLVTVSQQQEQQARLLAMLAEAWGVKYSGRVS